jgi:6-pyruvoyltetrahydropterin/6-carboxytetrahydropterin synthase
VYDKCNNSNGHGHDYYLEVTVKGQPDQETGMVIGLNEMDNKIHSVLEKLDYKHLDKQVPFFRENTSTGENIIHYLWQYLSEQFNDAQLHHLKLWETNNNYFEINRTTDNTH